MRRNARHGHGKARLGQRRKSDYLSRDGALDGRVSRQIGSRWNETSVNAAQDSRGAIIAGSTTRTRAARETSRSGACSPVPGRLYFQSTLSRTTPARNERWCTLRERRHPRCPPPPKFETAAARGALQQYSISRQMQIAWRFRSTERTRSLFLDSRISYIHAESAEKAASAPNSQQNRKRRAHIRVHCPPRPAVSNSMPPQQVYVYFSNASPEEQGRATRRNAPSWHLFAPGCTPSLGARERVLVGLACLGRGEVGGGHVADESLLHGFGEMGPVDVLVGILALCNVEDVLQMCKFLRDIVATRHLWLALLRGLPNDCAPNLPPHVSIVSLDFIGLKSLVVRAVCGNRNWNLLSPKITREIKLTVNDPRREPSVVVKKASLVPGGDYLMVQWSNSSVQLFEVSNGERIWLYPDPDCPSSESRRLWAYGVDRIAEKVLRVATAEIDKERYSKMSGWHSRFLKSTFVKGARKRYMINNWLS
ncbi:hypothetical protein DFH11DRAFT_1731834 [Phellopilus nigrolimitatus]|nr:hypothetical protein DFH11DRAFT_1731834 [Phellopilus nigrolimitatus]